MPGAEAAAWCKSETKAPGLGTSGPETRNPHQSLKVGTLI